MRSIIILTFCLFGISHCFIPAKIMSKAIFVLENEFKGNLGKVSESIVHDEIMKRGLLQSVVMYMIDHPYNSRTLDLTKFDNDYYDVRKLYFDYYGMFFFISMFSSFTVLKNI